MTRIHGSRPLPPCAVLHNNIGALLYRRGEFDNAKKHYQSAIEEASRQQELCENSDCSSSNALNHETAAGGLAWFHRKLLAEQRRGHVSAENSPHSVVLEESATPRRGLLRRNSSTTTLKPPSCHELTPLGLEYYQEPVTVTRVEDVMTASSLNAALLRYGNAASNDQLENIYTDLEQHNKSNGGEVSPIVAAAHDNNMGVLLFRLAKTKEALSHFEKANQALRDMLKLPWKQPIEEEDRLEFYYLRTSILLNHARTCVRLNNTITASRLVDEIQDIEGTVQKMRHNKCNHSSKIHGSSLGQQLQGRIRWMSIVSTRYIKGMIHQRREELTKALDCYKLFVTDARHELGHAHLHVATVLQMKGMVLFDQRKLHHAMLAQLACLKIYEQHAHAEKRDMSKVMYSIGRTLHDREEYRDALQMYHQTLKLQRQITTSNTSVDVVTTLCNIARVHHVVGDLDACLAVNQEVVEMARRLARGKNHPFVADRLQVLGNVLVEAGRLSEAMKAFADAARSAATNNENEHVRNSRYDISSRWASTLAKAGLQHPCAATA